jgi:deoxyribonuclease-4
MAENGLSDIVVHAPYIINLASFKPDTFELAVRFLRKEIERTEALGSDYIVLHPGSFTEKDLEYGVNRIADGLNMALSAERKPLVCLETMAGKGSEIGRNFEELRLIIDKVELKDKLRVCFDTCHAHDAGYDLVNDFDGVMRRFDEIIGLERLSVFHLNGSLNERGSRKDRHANIGAGDDNPRGADKIGKETIRAIAWSKYAEGKPLILETPWISDRENLYRDEIAFINQ